MTGVCFVGVLDTSGSKFFFVPVLVLVLVGLVGLGLGFVLLRPVRRFVKDVLRAETTELDKLAGKMGKNVFHFKEPAIYTARKSRSIKVVKKVMKKRNETKRE